MTPKKIENNKYKIMMYDQGGNVFGFYGAFDWFGHVRVRQIIGCITPESDTSEFCSPDNCDSHNPPHTPYTECQESVLFYHFEQVAKPMTDEYRYR